MLQRNPMQSRLFATLRSAVVRRRRRGTRRRPERGTGSMPGAGVQPALEKIDVSSRRCHATAGPLPGGLRHRARKRNSRGDTGLHWASPRIFRVPSRTTTSRCLYASQGKLDKANRRSSSPSTRTELRHRAREPRRTYTRSSRAAYTTARCSSTRPRPRAGEAVVVKDLFVSQKSAGATAPARGEPAPPPRPQDRAVAEGGGSASPADQARAEDRGAPGRADAGTGRRSPPRALRRRKAQVTAAIREMGARVEREGVKGYLGAYAADFEVPGGESRARGKGPHRAHREAQVDRCRREWAGRELTGNEARAHPPGIQVGHPQEHHHQDAQAGEIGERWIIKAGAVGG